MTGFSSPNYTKVLPKPSSFRLGMVVGPLRTQRTSPMKTRCLRWCIVLAATAVLLGGAPTASAQTEKAAAPNAKAAQPAPATKATPSAQAAPAEKAAPPDKQLPEAKPAAKPAAKPMAKPAAKPVAPKAPPKKK